MQKLIKLFGLKTCSMVLLFLWIATLFLLYIVHGESTMHFKQGRTLMSALHTVKAIELYHSDNGKFPQSIEELAPKYIAFVPPAEWGNSGWKYEINDKEFILRIGYASDNSSGSLYPVLTYSSSDRCWLLND